MKKSHYAWLATAAIIAVATASCSKFKKPLNVGYEEVTIEHLDSVSVDGTCIRSTSADQLRLVTPNNDTLSFNISEASRNKKIFGGFSQGDEVYLMLATTDSTLVQMVINKTALLGKWVHSDPIDGSSETGIEIKIGGDAKGILPTYVDYKSWRVLNGRLLIEEMRDEGMDSEYRSYQILALTPDSLSLRADDDPEAPYEYSRWKPNHEYDDLPADLELDDGMADAITW